MFNVSEDQSYYMGNLTASNLTASNLTAADSQSLEIQDSNSLKGTKWRWRPNIKNVGSNVAILSQPGSDMLRDIMSTFKARKTES